MNFTISHVGTLRFWGKWFGKPMDNIHCVAEANLDEENNVLTIYFDKGEICTIFNPVNIVSTDTQFHVSDASKVIWQYYSYGREHTPSNLISVEYEKTNASSVLIKTQNGTEKMNPANFRAMEVC